MMFYTCPLYIHYTSTKCSTSSIYFVSSCYFHGKGSQKIHTGLYTKKKSLADGNSHLKLHALALFLISTGESDLECHPNPVLTPHTIKQQTTQHRSIRWQPFVPRQKSILPAFSPGTSQATGQDYNFQVVKYNTYLGGASKEGTETYASSGQITLEGGATKQFLMLARRCSRADKHMLLWAEWKVLDGLALIIQLYQFYALIDFELKHFYANSNTISTKTFFVLLLSNSKFMKNFKIAVTKNSANMLYFADFCLWSWVNL